MYKSLSFDGKPSPDNPRTPTLCCAKASLKAFSQYKNLIKMLLFFNNIFSVRTHYPSKINLLRIILEHLRSLLRVWPHFGVLAIHLCISFVDSPGILQ